MNARARILQRRGLTLLLLLATVSCAPPLRDDVLLGTLERDRIDLVASATEPLLELRVRTGDQVTRGQVLGRLDDRRVAARLFAAEARAARADARVAELQRGGRSERREAAEARIAADRIELAQAALDRDRAGRLVAAEAVSQGELDVAATRLKTAQARIREDQAALAELTAGATTEELRQAHADLDAAQGDAAALRVDFERLTLRAPTDGRIDALPYEVGELP